MTTYDKEDATIPGSDLIHGTENLDEVTMVDDQHDRVKSDNHDHPEITSPGLENDLPEPPPTKR